MYMYIMPANASDTTGLPPGKPETLIPTTVTHESITFQWTMSVTSEGEHITGYIFETLIGADSDSPTPVTKHLPPNQLEYTVDSLYHRNTLYDFRVAAKNVHGTGPFQTSKFVNIIIPNH